MSSSTPSQAFRIQHSNRILQVGSFVHSKTMMTLVELEDIEAELWNSDRETFSTPPRISAVYRNQDNVNVALDREGVPIFPLSIVLDLFHVLDIVLQPPSPTMQSSEPLSSPMTPPIMTSEPEEIEDPSSPEAQPMSPGAETIVKKFAYALLDGRRRRMQQYHGHMTGRFSEAQIADITASLGALRQRHDVQNMQIADFKNFVDQRLKELNDSIQQNSHHIHEGNQEIIRQMGMLGERFMRQNYELFEHTTPRLFMVLPIKEQGVFVRKFKIHFLCECDDHQGWHHRGNSQVHVADHGGYVLERPTEFFRKYGKHVVRLMSFLKYGVIAAGVAVPIIAQAGFIEGLDNASRLIRDISEDLAGKTDFVIDHINSIGEHNVTTSSDRRQSNPIGQDILSSIEPLTGPELRQLQKFLRTKDEDNVYANLHKIVTPEGHVRWVCKHHKQEADRPASMAILQAFIRRVGGIFDSTTGVLVVFLPTRNDAKELYGIIQRFKFIYQLTVSFDWNIQETDLLKLKDAVALSSIRHLDIDGERYIGSWDPILFIMTNPNLQVLSVKKFKGFLQNVIWWPKNVKVRSLDFSEQIIWDSTVAKVMFACPMLSTLTMATKDIKSTFESIRQTAEQHAYLTTLNLKQSDPSRPSNADMPSVTYYFNKNRRAILSATLTLRTHVFHDLVQLPMIKKVVYQPTASVSQNAYEMTRSSALSLARRFVEMESFEYQCHCSHFQNLFAAIKHQHFEIKKQRLQNSSLRRIKLIDEHGSFIITQDIHDQHATRYNLEEASRLVQDGAEVPRTGIQRDQHGTSRGAVGAQKPSVATLQRAPYGGSVNNGRPSSRPDSALAALNAPPRYVPIDPLTHGLQAIRTQNRPHSMLPPTRAIPEDGSCITTLELDSTWTSERIKGIHDEILRRKYSALERLVWDITEFNNIYILKMVLAILSEAQRSRPSRKVAVEIKIRLVSGMSSSSGLSGGGNGYANQPGLSKFLESEDRSILWILFTSYVTRLELLGRNLDTFLLKLCRSFDWTMTELKELVIDGQSTQFSPKSLDYLQDVIRRGAEVTGTKTLKPGGPMTQLYIQNMPLFGQQWTPLLSSIDWLTLRQVNFRGSDFKLAQLMELETAVIRVVERCREMQRVLPMNQLGARDAAMVQDLMVRQSGEALLMVSLYRTEVTDQQLLEAQERLYKRGESTSPLTPQPPHPRSLNHSTTTTTAGDKASPGISTKPQVPFMEDEYQCFRSRGELVRVRLSSHPSTGPTARYVFWGDLRMCFPGIVRIQHNDIYVPFMRGKKEYRLKPLRIQHIPDVLDVIYDDILPPPHPAPICPVATASSSSSSSRKQLPSAPSSQPIEALVFESPPLPSSITSFAPTLSAQQSSSVQDNLKKQGASIVHQSDQDDKSKESAAVSQADGTQERGRGISQKAMKDIAKGNDPMVEALSGKDVRQNSQKQRVGHETQSEPIPEQLQQKLKEQEQRQIELEKQVQAARQTMKPAELQALEQALEQGRNPHDLIQDKIRELMQRIQVPGQKPGQQKVQKKVAKPIQKPTPKQVPGRLRDLVHIQVPEHMEGVDIDNLTIEEFIKLSSQTTSSVKQGSIKQEPTPTSPQPPATKLQGSSTGHDSRGAEFNLAVDIFIEEAPDLSSKGPGKLVEVPKDQSLFKLIEAASASTGLPPSTALTVKNSGESPTLSVMNTALERALSQAILGAVTDPKTAGVQPSVKGLPTTNKALSARSTNVITNHESTSTAPVPTSTFNGNVSGASEVAILEQSQAILEETEEEKLAREAALINYELAREGLVATARLFEAFIQASAKGHLSVADKIGLELNRQLRELEAKLGHNSLLRPEFAHLCNALSDTQRSLALIREPLIHNRIQAVLANRMGVLDQQVPRIFVILPKPGCPGDFRVHFMCECGEYDGSPKKGKVPKHIHLTDHPGYDIQHKRRFMETYGTYMLDFLNLFKYGVSLDVMMMAPLDSSSKLLAQIHESMEYLLDVPSASEPHGNGWLKDVAYCLQVSPRESCIGSLYRVVSQEGDTRWICQDHYEHLQLNTLNDKFVQISKGFKVTYSDPHHSLFHFLLQDRIQAEKLYAELELDPPIQDLGLLLDWAVTPKDLNRVLEVLKRLSTPVIRLFLQRPERPDDSLKASKDALYVYMLGNIGIQVFLMGEIAISFKRTEPRARLMRVRREMELKHGTRDMFTTLTITRDSLRRTNITLVYHSVERGLELVKKHMGANFPLLIKLDVDTGDVELAKITFKNGDTVQLHLRALTPASNYLLLSSLIRSLNVSIWDEHHVVELEKIIKRNQGMDSLDIRGPRRIMISAYNMIKAQFPSHPGLNKITMKFDGITISFSVDSSGGPVLELQTFVAAGLDEIVSATAADLNVFFAQPSDAQARAFEQATGSDNAVSEANIQEVDEADLGRNGGAIVAVSNSNLEGGGVVATRMSRLTMLNLDLSDLTRPGLGSFARVINNSPDLEKLDLRIYCSKDNKMDWEAFGAFMGCVSRKITGLLIKGPQFNSLLEQLFRNIPDPATMLTSLVVFEIRGAGELQHQVAGSLHEQDVQAMQEQAQMVIVEQAVQWTGLVERRYFEWINGVERLPKLTHLSFRQVWIDAVGWEMIMDAMNFFVLIRVDIQDANFGTAQMDRLANLMGPESLGRAREERAAVDAGTGTGGNETSKAVVKNEEGANGAGTESAVVVAGKTARVAGGAEEPMSLFSIQLLCVFLCEAPDNDMLQRWDYLLKFRTNQLLYQCEIDPPIAQRTQTD
ncbi:hypothetical protein BGW39_001623 [Mortierella sp. 14UC]|nr:hypothetical protein BGW39_001623 [Mortierella sp. 14UC]